MAKSIKTNAEARSKILEVSEAVKIRVEVFDKKGKLVRDTTVGGRMRRK